MDYNVREDHRANKVRDDDIVIPEQVVEFKWKMKKSNQLKKAITKALVRKTFRYVTVSRTSIVTFHTYFTLK